MKLFEIIFLIFVSAFAYAQQSYTETKKLYDDKEVAIIRIQTSPEAIEYMFSHPQSDSLHLCTVHFKNRFFDETIDSVGIRIRGNTSRQAKKKSFKLSINEYIKGRTFHGVDKINLNGEHNDPSIIRSKLCWDLFNKIGMNSSRAAHAAVYINGKYYGLYVSVEHIDDEFLKKNFADASGNLWKCLWPADLTYKGDDPSLYKTKIGNRKIYELKTNEDENDYSQLARLIRIINKTPFAEFRDSIENILNVSEVLKYFAVNILTGSWDDYRFLKNNYYLYYEPLQKRFHWIPYDYDNTFGIDWFGYDWATIDPYNYPTIDNTPRPLTERLFKVPEYRNLYSHFLKFYSENVFALPLWEGKLDSLKEMITPFALADTFRTLDCGFDSSDFLNSYTDGDYSNQHVKYGLKKFVNKRVESLTNQIYYYTAPPFVYNIRYFPSHPGLKDSVKFEASIFSSPQVSQALLTVKNEAGGGTKSFTLKPDFVTNTFKAEEADRWDVVIPPLNKGKNTITLTVTNDAGLKAVFPRGRKLSIEIHDSSEQFLHINELMAINDHTIADEYGEYDDWAEIYNASDTSINLENYFLSDSKSKLTKWKFPENTKIDAGGFLLVWCDKDDQPGLHTNFKLSGSGEFLALVAPDGKTVIDSFSFGQQTADVSYGRFPDGSENLQFLKPTPGAPNETSSVENSKLPSSFSLSVYPNPLNASVAEKLNIQYSLPSDKKAFTGNVSLAVYNSLGQLVRKLKIAGATNRTIRLNVKGFANGVYFISLLQGTERKTVKFLLMR